MTIEGDRSYRALFTIPDLRKVVFSMQFARVAQAMTSVALVLFTLQKYNSPALTGIVTALSILPGLLISPLAGALLDRHGRVRLIRLDYVVAMVTMLLIAGLSIAGALTPELLIVISVISSLTGPFSQTGMRSLFPLMVPEHLWERINAVDSNGYLIATIFGPPLAAAMFAIFGGDAAILAIAVPYGVAAALTIGVREPNVFAATSGRLLRDAWDGLRYAWSNLTIRGLIFSISALNVGWGVTTIVIPLMVIDRLALPEWVVGIVYALSGVAGMISVFVFGRVDLRGREWRMLVYPMLPMAPVTALLLLAGSPAAVAAPLAGLAVMITSQFLLGLLGGPMDIALFTMRQRRTDPAWIGRAFAVSMALNFIGFPIGAAIAGTLAAVSLELAIGAAVVAAVLGVVFAIFLVPRNEPDELPVAEVSRP